MVTIDSAIDIGLVQLLLVTITFIAILLWIFRPKSTKYYDQISKIPLEENRLHKDEDSAKK